MLGIVGNEADERGSATAVPLGDTSVDELSLFTSPSCKDCMVFVQSGPPGADSDMMGVKRVVGRLRGVQH